MQTVVGCLFAELVSSGSSAHVAGRSTAPVVTKRDEAISSLRARATIMVLRTPAFRAGVNHCAKALAFWNMSQCHASRIMPRRTRALPALAGQPRHLAAQFCRRVGR